MREERKERRDELENELAKIKQRFKEKEDVMAEEHGRKEEELFELKVEREAFGEEMKSLQEKKDRVSKQYEEQKERYANEESNMQLIISMLNADMKSYRMATRKQGMQKPQTSRALGPNSSNIQDIALSWKNASIG